MAAAETSDDFHIVNGEEAEQRDETEVGTGGGQGGHVWQKGILSLRDGISYVYKNTKFVDVQFKVCKEEFLGHRLILGASSPEFAKILFKKSLPTDEKGLAKVVIEDVSPTGFKTLLDFIYTGTFESSVDQREAVLEAHRAARRFKLRDLLQQCEELFEEWDITSANVCAVLGQAGEVPSMRERCLNYIRANYDEVLGSTGFEKAAPDTVWQMLNAEIFEAVYPMVLISNILRWACALQVTPNYAEIRAFLLMDGKPMLPLLRIETLSADEIADVHDRYPGLLTDSDVANLVMYATGKGEKWLPKWCKKAGSGTPSRCESLRSVS